MKPAHSITKEHHVYVPPTPAPDPLAKNGYQEKKYEHQEYPKVLDLKDPDGKDLTASDEKHEAELRKLHGKKAEAKEESKEESKA